MFEDYLKLDSKQKRNQASRIQVTCKKIHKSLEQLQCWKLRLSVYEVEPLKSYYFFNSKEPYFFIISKENKNIRTLVYKSQPSKNFNEQQFKEFHVRRKIFQ